MRNERKPPLHIRLDPEAARLAGIRGSEQRKKNEAARAQLAREQAEKAEAEEWARMKQANEHIIPPPSPYGD